jgi:hypothetical protein
MDNNLENVKLLFHQDKDEIIKTYSATGAGIGKDDERYVIVVYINRYMEPGPQKYWKTIPLKFKYIGEILLQ